MKSVKLAEGGKMKEGVQPCAFGGAVISGRMAVADVL